MKTLATLVIAYLLTSCSVPVKESQRDRESTYRGFWSANYLGAPSLYSAGNVRIKCWDMAGSGSLEIAGGRVVVRALGYDLGGFVDEEGKVTAEVSLKHNMKFILNGRLDASTGKGTGRLIHALESLGNQGCSTAVEFTKAPV